VAQLRGQLGKEAGAGAVLAPHPVLIITADDWGYSPAYNSGILEAAEAAAIDAVSAMVRRPWCDPAPLRRTGVEVGLHLEVDALADPEVDRARAAVSAQVERFERLFGRPPAYVDGHHHCHAWPGFADVVAELAAVRAIPVRSVDDEHRDLLRARGIATQDRLIGRLGPDQPARPPELDRLPDGVTEWMVHPGSADPGAGSSYDGAREEDLMLVLALGQDVGLRALRLTHAEAFAAR
jgi:predicted glycoside hydrolase/deacetylase ChbG (UPF0249 family)